MHTRLINLIGLMVFCLCLGLGCSSGSSGYKIVYKDLSVTTNPSGATVKIGDQIKTSPAKFSKVKRKGKNQFYVQISKDGYMPGHYWPKGTASSINAELVKIEEAKNKCVGIHFKKLAVIPNVVPPNSPFGFRVEYEVFDNTIVDKEVPIELAFAIMEGEKMLYRDSTNLVVPNFSYGHKIYVTEKLNLRSGRIPGKYKFQVCIKYKDKRKTITTLMQIL